MGKDKITHIMRYNCRSRELFDGDRKTGQRGTDGGPCADEQGQGQVVGGKATEVLVTYGVEGGKSVWDVGCGLWNVEYERRMTMEEHHYDRSWACRKQAMRDLRHGHAVPCHACLMLHHVMNETPSPMHLLQAHHLSGPVTNLLALDSSAPAILGLRPDSPRRPYRGSGGGEGSWPNWALVWLTSRRASAGEAEAGGVATRLTLDPLKPTHCCVLCCGRVNVGLGAMREVASQLRNPKTRRSTTPLTSHSHSPSRAARGLLGNPNPLEAQINPQPTANSPQPADPLLPAVGQQHCCA
ncbi:hypothetical protein EDB80DRAFT_683500 [Ilyonectria destructans]|nr:hypothetical protein EDB80DRAFT_683500 [Ilyonectria destructans]